MVKLMNSPLYKTTAEYAENSTVHGVKYIFEKVDQLMKSVLNIYHYFLAIVFSGQVSVGYTGDHCTGSVMFPKLPSLHVL